MNTRGIFRSAFFCAVLAAAAFVWASPTSPASAELGHFSGNTSVALSSVAPGAARGMTVTMVTPVGDLLDAGMDPYGGGPGPIVFEPAGVTITPGCNKPGYRDFNNNNVIDTGETPCLAQGAAAGTHTWQATLGVANNPCNSPLQVPVDLYNVAMPNNEVDPRLSTNIVFPHAQGTTDRFLRWRLGGPPLGINGSAQTPGLEEEIIDGGDGKADAPSFPLQNFPSYLLDLTDPDGAGPIDPVLPLAVYGGLTEVSGEWWPFYFMQFESGDLPTAFVGLSPHPYERAAAPLGHPLQPVMGDPTATTAPAATAATDICAPATTITTLPSTVGGVTRAANPATAGTHMVLAWRVTQRDLDNDGYENRLDTCPGAANVDNPLVTTGADLDAFGFPAGDMLDPACDPSPTGNGSHNLDQDGDGDVNADDNCPLASNASQIESELEYPPDYFNNAFDGGPLEDHMGDACETGNTVTPIAQTVADGGDGITATQISFTYGLAATPELTQGSYIIVDSEVMQVSDVAGPTNTVVVKRGAAGTSAVVHAESAPIGSIVGITTTLNGVNTPFVFSTTTANGHWHAQGDVFAECYSTAPVDADGDGYCASGTVGCVGACVVDLADSGSCTTTTPSSCAVRHNQWTTTPSFAHLLLFDTDRGGGDSSSVVDSGGIGVIPFPQVVCPGGSTDRCPNWGFDSDWMESYLGIDPTRPCNMNSAIGDERFDAWLPDVNDDQRSNLSDTTSSGTVYNRFVNDTALAGQSGGYSTDITLAAPLGASPTLDVSLTYAGLDVAAIGDYVTIDSEMMQVMRVDAGTNTLRVKRGLLGLPIVSHATSTSILRTAGTRFDMNVDGLVNLSDILERGQTQSLQCRRIDGTFGQQQ